MAKADIKIKGRSYSVACAPGQEARLIALSRQLDARIEDISKTHVSRVFESVFGYSLAIDPLTYEGPAVCKSELNGTHDGKIVQCPIPAQEVEPGSVYQRFVDSASDGVRSEDLRTTHDS